MKGTRIGKILSNRERAQQLKVPVTECFCVPPGRACELAIQGKHDAAAALQAENERYISFKRCIIRVEPWSRKNASSLMMGWSFLFYLPKTGDTDKKKKGGTPMEQAQTQKSGSTKPQAEICDIYDVYGNRTGKTFVRGEPLSDGQYVMVVDVWIVNSRDEILIQKRSELKKDLPGTWATHSGCVLAGESAQQACIREPMEEIGIRILPSQIHKLNRKLRGKLLSENFVVEQDFDAAKAVLQEEEVSQIKWVTVSQLKQMASRREFYRYPEFFDVVRFLEQRRKRTSAHKTSKE